MYARPCRYHQKHAGKTLIVLVETQLNKTSPSSEFEALLPLLSGGRYADAAHGANRLVQQHPGFGPAWKLLGNAIRMMGQDDLAALERASALLPDDDEVHYYLGEARKRHGNLTGALASYREVARIRPDFHGAFVNLGIAQFALGDWTAAEASYRQALALQPASPEALFNLAILLRKRDQLDEAIACLVTATELQPRFAQALRHLADAQMTAGRSSDAEVSLRRLIALLPGTLEVHLALAELLYRSGRLAEAEQALRELVAIRPDCADGYVSLGRLLLARNDLTAAEKALRQAISIVPDHADAYACLGTVLLWMGRNIDADAAYAQALKKRPDFRQLHQEKAFALRELGRHDAALSEFMLAYQPDWDWQSRLTRLTRQWVVLEGRIHRKADPASAQQSVTGPDGRTVAFQNAPEVPLSSGLEIAPATSSTTKYLRIILLYPPPWQIPLAGESYADSPFAAPQDGTDTALDADFRTIPYGLLTIAAEARRAGHTVELLNLSATPWPTVVQKIATSSADIFGISAYTANRRGLGAVAKLIRTHHPTAHITAGGPFVTALPLPTLRHFPEIDTAVIGEGELTFMDLVTRIADSRPASGIPGTAFRSDDGLRIGPPRQRIKDIDALASPFDYFASSIVMTSRGCPSDCSFCGSKVMWGRKLRFHSVESSLTLFHKALSRLAVPFLAIKDDTFTAHRKRAIAICDEIIARGMRFLWSCDTRVDCLDDELLYKMRLAGCQRISLGVESGSPEILASIKKKTTPGAILDITRSARKYGLQVRYYMIIGNRGESVDTIQQSIELIQAGRPNFVFLCFLSFYPGTEEWKILQQREGLSAEFFFDNDFREFSVASGRNSQWLDLMTRIHCQIGGFGFDYTIEEREAVAQLLPDLDCVHLELANAYLRAGHLDKAETALQRAEALGFPIEGMIDNQRACLALARGRIDDALSILVRAMEKLPASILLGNLDTLQGWYRLPASSRSELPILNNSVQAADFQSVIQQQGSTLS